VNPITGPPLICPPDDGGGGVPTHVCSCLTVSSAAGVSNGSLALYAALIKLLESSLLLALLLSFTHPTGCGGGVPLVLSISTTAYSPHPCMGRGDGGVDCL